MYWTDSSLYIELNITKKQAYSCYHPGPCDSDIQVLRDVPAIKRQLDKLNPETVALVLKVYGAWDDDDLSNHDDNLDRLLWIACGDIVENNV